MKIGNYKFEHKDEIKVFTERAQRYIQMRDNKVETIKAFISQHLHTLSQNQRAFNAMLLRFPKQCNDKVVMSDVELKV